LWASHQIDEAKKEVECWRATGAEVPQGIREKMDAAVAPAVP
jgi:hypothetical protein